MVALTATATPEDQDVIASSLGLGAPLVLRGSLNRQNIKLSVTWVGNTMPVAYNPAVKVRDLSCERVVGEGRIELLLR